MHIIAQTEDGKFYRFAATGEVSPSIVLELDAAGRLVHIQHGAHVRVDVITREDGEALARYVSQAEAGSNARTTTAQQIAEHLAVSRPPRYSPAPPE